MKEALGWETNSTCLDLRNCKENIIENMHADVRI